MKGSPTGGGKKKNKKSTSRSTHSAKRSLSVGAKPTSGGGLPTGGALIKSKQQKVIDDIVLSPVPVSSTSPRPAATLDVPNEILDAREAMAARIVEFVAKLDPQPDFDRLGVEFLQTLRDADDLLGDLAGATQWEHLKPALSWATTEMLRQPLRRREILDRLAEAVKTDTALQFGKWLEQLSLSAIKAGNESTDLVLRSDPERLKSLPLKDKRDLLASICDSMTEGDNAKQVQALTLLYPMMELDPAFDQKDSAIRRKVAERLSRDLGKDVRRWHLLKDEQKQAVVEKAVAIHSEEFGIKDRTPKIQLKVLSTPNVRSCGQFSSVEGAIHIDPTETGWRELDETLDTAIHENTHNYQDWLSTRLASIEPDDPIHLQASLFALNSLAYLTPKKDVAVDKEAFALYKSQPVERHAWMAGGEVRGLWLQDARAEAMTVLGQVDPKFSGHAVLASAVKNDSVTTTQLYKMIDFLLGQQADEADEAVRGQCVADLKALQQHPRAVTKMHEISLLLTRALLSSVPVSTDELKKQTDRLRVEITGA